MSTIHNSQRVRDRDAKVVSSTHAGLLLLVLTVGLFGCESDSAPDTGRSGGHAANDGSAAGTIDSGGTVSTDASVGNMDAGNLAGMMGLDGGSESCELRYTEGHGDLYLDDVRGSLVYKIRAELEPGRGEQLYEPSRVCIIVGKKSYALVESYGGRPPGADWDFTGAREGESFWILPEVAEEGIPWFGMSTEGIQYGRLKDNSVTFRMTNVVRPPGAEVAVWDQGGSGDLGQRMLYSTKEQDFEWTTSASSHAHMTWSFTRAGDYRITFVAEAIDDVTSSPLSSAPATVRFVVED